MPSLIDKLLSRPEIVDARRKSQAPQNVIDDLATRFGAGFPESLLQLWHNAGGINLDALDAHILSPEEIAEANEPGPFVENGLVPLLDDRQSNYVALMVNATLAFRVAYMPHDDCCRLVYRDLEGFARGMLQALDDDVAADEFFHETEGDYTADAPRSNDDQQAALALLTTEGRHGEWNYAIQLLDASDLGSWAKLLETDHFVRRDALARMRNMQSPEIQQLLRRDQLQYLEFTRAIADACRAKGLDVLEHDNRGLQIGGKWIHLEVFFYRRNIPNAMTRLLAVFEDWAAGRDPRKRPDYFLAD